MRSFMQSVDICSHCVSPLCDFFESLNFDMYWAAIRVCQFRFQDSIEREESQGSEKMH